MYVAFLTFFVKSYVDSLIHRLLGVQPLAYFFQLFFSMLVQGRLWIYHGKVQHKSFGNNNLQKGIHFFIIIFDENDDNYQSEGGSKNFLLM